MYGTGVQGLKNIYLLDMSLIGRPALSRAENNEWPDRAQVNSGARFSLGSENHDNPLSWNRTSHAGSRINLAVHGASRSRSRRCAHLCWPMPPDMAVGVPGSDALFYWLLRCGDPTRDEHHAPPLSCPVTRLPRVAWLAALLLAGCGPDKPVSQVPTTEPMARQEGGARLRGAGQCPPISGCPGAGAGLLRPLGAQGKLAELAFCE